MMIYIYMGLTVEGLGGHRWGMGEGVMNRGERGRELEEKGL